MATKWVERNGYRVCLQNMDGPEWGLRTWVYEAINRECGLKYPYPVTQENFPVWEAWTKKLMALANESLEGAR